MLDEAPVKDFIKIEVMSRKRRMGIVFKVQTITHISLILRESQFNILIVLFDVGVVGVRRG